MTRGFNRALRQALKGEREPVTLAADMTTQAHYYAAWAAVEAWHKSGEYRRGRQYAQRFEIEGDERPFDVVVWRDKRGLCVAIETR